MMHKHFVKNTSTHELEVKYEILQNLPLVVNSFQVNNFHKKPAFLVNNTQETQLLVNYRL